MQRILLSFLLCIVFQVLHKYGERLYTGLKQVVEDHLRNYVGGLIITAQDGLSMNLGMSSMG